MATLLARGQITIAAIKDGKDGKPGADGKNYWQQDVWVDLSAATYDQNIWYPVAGERLPQTGFAGIKVVVNLNSGTKPSWSTHSAGFSVDFHVDTQASDWGTTPGETIIYSDNYNWCHVSPVSYKQIVEPSVPILYLRGGGKYRVYSTYETPWTIKKDGYKWQSGPYSASAMPSSTRPTPEGHTLKGGKGDKGDQGDRGPQGPTGAAGKDAVSASFSPAALTFSATTDSNGNCLADVSSGNTATITMLEGSSVVTGSYVISSAVGCSASVAADGTVTVKSVAYDTIDGRAISRTSASVTVKCVYNGKTCYVSLPISVSVSAVWGGLVTSQKGLESKYTEVSNKYNALPLKTPEALTQYTSTIKQTAREISLKVSQTAVGRKNLLVGSAFCKQSDKWAGNDSYRPYISVLNQYNGHNSVVLENGANTYHGLDFFRVPVKTGKYTAGVMAKFNGKPENGSFAIYVARKDADDKQIGNNSWIAVEVSNVVVGQWSLYSTSFDIEDKCKLIDLCFIYTNNPTAWFAQPMLVEGDEYVGWSLSEEDAEYIGGNLLDNTDTLSVGGNLVVANGTLRTDANSYNGFPTRQVNMIDNSSAYIDFIQWDFEKSDVLVKGQDYMFSFWAKGNKGGNFACFLYGSKTSDAVFVEKENSMSYNQTTTIDGHAPISIDDDYAWHRYCVHWRICVDDKPKHVMIRCPKGTDMYVSQPKLEYGATVTEYRATKTDYIEDKSVAGKLLDAGIDIDSKEITLTADKTKFRTRSGQKVAVFDENGLNAKLIRAERLEAIGFDSSRVLIERGLAQFFGTNGVCNIRVGVDNTGCSVLQFFDSNGLMTYDLGPSGLSKISITKGTLTSSRYYDMLAAGCTSPIGVNRVFRSAIAGQEVSAYVASKTNDTVLFGNKGVGFFPITDAQYLVTLYSYSAPTVNGVIQADPEHGLTTKALAEAANGKMFKSKTMVVNGAIANLADGKYIPQENSSSIKDGEDYFHIPWETKDDYIECPYFCVPGITTINKGLKGRYLTVFSIETKYIFQKDSGMEPIRPT